MKANRILLLLFSIAATALVVSSRLRPLDQGVVVSVAEVLQPMEESVLSAEPTATVDPPQQIEALVAVVEPKRPIQSLEERGDAMLFESEALFGTPFDQAIVMPFE